MISRLLHSFARGPGLHHPALPVPARNPLGRDRGRGTSSAPRVASPGALCAGARAVDSPTGKVRVRLSGEGSAGLQADNARQAGGCAAARYRSPRLGIQPCSVRNARSFFTCSHMTAFFLGSRRRNAG